MDLKLAKVFGETMRFDRAKTNPNSHGIIENTNLVWGLCH